MHKLIKILNRFRKLYVFLMIVYFVHSGNAQPQSFRIVGCKGDGETQAIGLFSNELIHSGFFNVCGKIVHNIGSWNNLIWDSLSVGLDPNLNSRGIYALQEYKNNLYVGGGYYVIGGKTTNKIARWNGIQWDSVGKGLDAQGNLEKITSMAVYKNELYVAGLFRQVDGVTGYNHIAVWNGTSWRKIGGLLGSLPEVYCMAVYKNELYVGGLFTQAGFTPANFIARWDGQQWKRVGGGANYAVQAMVVDTVSNLLYVGGAFDRVNNNISCRVAQWDGVNWSAVGDSSIFKSNVFSLEMYHGYLFAGGMSPHGLVTDTCLARWDGNAWEPILGPSSTITCLKTYKDELYLGGSFKMINNDSIPYLARYYSADSVAIGIRQNKKKRQAIEVYPNPINNKLIVKSDCNFNQFTIYDLLGNLKLEGYYIYEIDVSALKSGIYVLKVKNESMISTSKFIKE